jgi:hypothetical protein
MVQNPRKVQDSQAKGAECQSEDGKNKCPVVGVRSSPPLATLSRNMNVAMIARFLYMGYGFSGFQDQPRTADTDEYVCLQYCV